MPAARPGAPVHEPPEQPDRLAARRHRADAQGPLPCDCRALQEPRAGAFPRGVRSHPRLPEAGRSRTRWTRTRTRFPACFDALAHGRGGRHLPRGHDAFRGACPAHQDRRRPHRAGVRGRAHRQVGRRAHADPRRAHVRRAQVLPGLRARRVRRADLGQPPTSPPTARIRSRRWTRFTTAIQWAMQARSSTSTDRTASSWSAPWRSSTGATWSGSSSEERGLSARAIDPLRHLPDHRRCRRLLRGARARARRELWREVDALPRAAGRVSRAGSRPSGAGSSEDGSPGASAGPGRPSLGLPIFAYGAARQRARVLRAALAGASDRQQGDRLRDDAAARERRRLPAVLGAGDLARVAARWRDLGGRLRGCHSRSPALLAYRYLGGARRLGSQIRLRPALAHAAPGRVPSAVADARRSSACWIGPRPTTSRPPRGSTF